MAPEVRSYEVLLLREGRPVERRVRRFDAESPEAGALGALEKAAMAAFVGEGAWRTLDAARRILARSLVGGLAEAQHAGARMVLLQSEPLLCLPELLILSGGDTQSELQDAARRMIRGGALREAPLGTRRDWSSRGAWGEVAGPDTLAVVLSLAGNALAGPAGAREVYLMYEDWVAATRDACASLGVPFVSGWLGDAVPREVDDRRHLLLVAHGERVRRDSPERGTLEIYLEPRGSPPHDAATLVLRRSRRGRATDMGVCHSWLLSGHPHVGARGHEASLPALYAGAYEFLVAAHARILLNDPGFAWFGRGARLPFLSARLALVGLQRLRLSTAACPAPSEDDDEPFPALVR